MVSFFGDYNTTETIKIPFNTFDSNDPSASATITNLVAADIHIHKDGAVVQRASASGVTVSIDFDGITGNHIVSIDLSDNTTVGFYSDGSRYQVRMEGTTVDAGTINGWIGSFSIGCSLRPTTSGMTLDVSATGEAGLDFDNIKDATGTHTLTNITVPVCSVNSDMVGTDNAALAATALTDATWTDAAAGSLIDWINGGRLDLLLNAIPTTAMRGTDSANTVVPDIAGTAATLHGVTDGKVDSVQTDTTAIVADTGTDGVVVAAASKTGYTLSAAGIDGIFDEVTENSISLRDAVNLFLSAMTGISSGGGTTTLTFRDTADSKNRLVVTVDANNNRTAVGTRDGS